MSAVDRLARLQALGRPALSTGEAAVAWDSSLPAASKMLSRLAAGGLVTKVRSGIWHVGADTPDPAAVLPVLTAPYPSYISGWSALSRHQMIEQIPRGVFAVSLDRPKVVETTHGRYEIHRIHPRLFGGFDGATGTRAGVATPAKALFDVVYLFSARQGDVTLPELELPESFDHDELQEWVAKVPAARLRTLTAANLDRIVAGASPQYV